MYSATTMLMASPSVLMASIPVVATSGGFCRRRVASITIKTAMTMSVTAFIVAAKISIRL